MRLLLYSWKANNEQILVNNLIEMGLTIVCFQKECVHYTRDMNLAMEMIPFIHAEGIEAVISFNYFPIISMICNTCGVPYYAWVYDCPHFTLYAKQVTMSCNHIGIFDREMVRKLREYGVNTVYHVPLSTDAAYFEQIIAHTSQEKKEKYRCDVSFVGSLYTGEHNYYDTLINADYIKDMNGGGTADTDSIIDKQCFSYHQDYLKPFVANGSVNLKRVQNEMEKQGLTLGEDYFARAEDILVPAVLEKKVTVEERRILLTEIAGRYDFRLYTGSKTRELPELDRYNCGVVDYHTQMPHVFADSKINLNISLRSIRSGIPLRVLDIMACGGFVLTNWQPEIEECFDDGIELVTFESLEDCLNKISYYLEHEEERRQIAFQGQRKVREDFSYQIGIERLFA